MVWAVFFIYAAYMSWRRQSVQRELRELRGQEAPAASDSGYNAAGGKEHGDDSADPA